MNPRRSANSGSNEVCVIVRTIIQLMSPALWYIDCKQFLPGYQFLADSLAASRLHFCVSSIDFDEQKETACSLYDVQFFFSLALGLFLLLSF